jgi:hypothetical protein
VSLEGVRPARGRLFAALIVSLVLGSCLIPRTVAGQHRSAGEYELKAAMLYNLTNFVEWPAKAHADPRAAIRLCIIGRDPFGHSLVSAVSSATGTVRAVSIRHIESEKEVGGCHVLYISSSERNSAPQIFSLLNGSSILTVGEMTQFAAHGGMIQFSLEDQQVHFDINLEVASRAGLKISSKLLALAHIVKN